MRDNLISMSSDDLYWVMKKNDKLILEDCVTIDFLVARGQERTTENDKIREILYSRND